MNCFSIIYFLYIYLFFQFLLKLPIVDCCGNNNSMQYLADKTAHCPRKKGTKHKNYLLPAQDTSRGIFSHARSEWNLCFSNGVIPTRVRVENKDVLARAGARSGENVPRKKWQSLGVFRQTISQLDSVSWRFKPDHPVPFATVPRSPRAPPPSSKLQMHHPSYFHTLLRTRSGRSVPAASRSFRS